FLLVPAYTRSQELWLDLPADQSAIIIVIGGDVAERTFSLLGSFHAPTAGIEISDIATWPASSAFVRQYRLRPGNYQVSVPGPSEPVLVSAIAGTFTILQYNVIGNELTPDLTAELFNQHFSPAELEEGEIFSKLGYQLQDLEEYITTINPKLIPYYDTLTLVPIRPVPIPKDIGKPIPPKKSP
ncbi:MAG: hypothetical protein ACE5Q3_02330, partial [Alphaproteobacteria bacterium]